MKKFSITSMITGILIGAMLFGGISAVASELAIKPTTSKVTVDGVEVAVDAYNINYSNYFKLRDFTAAVDIGVWYDSATDTVHIETDKGYDPNYAGPTADVSQASKTTVYVSDASSTIHSVSDCGGMKNYKTMSLSDARAITQKYCDTCGGSLMGIQ